jgi:hypothetical protein
VACIVLSLAILAVAAYAILDKIHRHREIMSDRRDVSATTFADALERHGDYVSDRINDKLLAKR